MTTMADDRTLSGSAEHKLSLRDVLGILRRQRGVSVRVLVVALALGALASLTMRPSYRAQSAITADKAPPVILLDHPGQATQDLGTSVGLESPDIQTLVALAKSRTVADQAVTRLSAAHG